MRRLAAPAALALLLGCSGPRPGDPPRLRPGVDACARCGMIVSEERFAAGYVSDAGESVIFDDLGELLAALDEHPELRPRAWARDFNGGGWVRLEAAYTARAPGLATPMGTGWLAFSRASDADRILKGRAPGQAGR